MAKDEEDLLPDEVPVEEPGLQEAPQEAEEAVEPSPEGGAEPPPADEGGGEEVAIEDSAIASGIVPAPFAPVEDAKPKSNVWTLLMIITFVVIVVGIYLQGRELNEIYRVKFWMFK